MTTPQTLFDIAGVEVCIHTLPGYDPFILDADMATIYDTTTKRINEAVKRNPERFPADFCLTLTEADLEELRSQNATASMSRALPRAFTHIGAYALSGVLKTPVAAEMSVIIHRAFAAIERQAHDQAQFMLDKLRTEETARRPIRWRVVEGVRLGYSFKDIWRMTSYSRPRLAQAARECLALGLIEALPRGMPAAQPDLFGGSR